MSRGGYDWADRLPAIVEAARRLRLPSFLIDGEAVVCRHDGLSDFNALRSRRCDHDVTTIAELQIGRAQATSRAKVLGRAGR